ncbi:hypothetical protein ADK42_27325, partial [Streptomyces rimosus subsp. rimosus]
MAAPVPVAALMPVVPEAPMAALVPVPPAVGGRSRRGCGPPSRRAPGRSTSVICGPPRRPAPTCAAFRSCAAHRSRADGYG